MRFKVWLESKVLAHVSGASGSGKTTLANNLSKIYKDIIFKDLDDFDDEAVRKLKYPVKKDDYTDDMINLLADCRQKLMDEFIQKSKNPIIFVGHHTEGSRVLHIPTKNRFMLNTSAKTSAYRAYKRSQHEDPKYRRTLKELPSDEKEAQEIIDWLRKHNYKSVSVDEVEKWVSGQAGIGTHKSA